MPFNINHMTPVLFGVNMSFGLATGSETLAAPKSYVSMTKGSRKPAFPTRSSIISSRSE